MHTADFEWRAEEACLNAWPSPRQVIAAGWLMRISGGSTRRVNSVNPLRAAPYDPRVILPAAKTLYRLHGQPLIFRVPSIAKGMDAPLEQLGFVAQAETCTLAADLGETVTDDRSVELADMPSAAWLEARERIVPSTAAQQRIFRAMIAAMAWPKAFAALRVDGQVATLAYGIIHDGLLVLEAVATHAAYRRQGLARRTMGRLVHWARTEGAPHACLQVVADNTAARALYRSLGFSRELYRYHYRCEPAAG